MNSEIKNFVVTFGAIRHFFIVRGALRACVDFCDSTAVSRLKPMNFLCPPLPFTFEYFDFHLIGTDVDLCEVVITNYTKINISPNLLAEFGFPNPKCQRGNEKFISLRNNRNQFVEALFKLNVANGIL